MTWLQMQLLPWLGYQQSLSLKSHEVSLVQNTNFDRDCNALYKISEILGNKRIS